MSFPIGNPPDGAFRFGTKYGFDIDKDKATAFMTGGVKKSYADARSAMKQNVDDPLSDKPSLSQVPINSPMWQSLGVNEDTTFPRSQLTFGAASSTSTGGGNSGSHSHSLRQVPTTSPPVTDSTASKSDTYRRNGIGPTRKSGSSPAARSPRSASTASTSASIRSTQKPGI